MQVDPCMVWLNIEARVTGHPSVPGGPLRLTISAAREQIRTKDTDASKRNTSRFLKDPYRSQHEDADCWLENPLPQWKPCIQQSLLRQAII